MATCYSEDEELTVIFHAEDYLAKMIVYSMAVDGPVRPDTPPSRGGDFSARQTGYIAGSKAMDSLDRLITSTESFFHPSNSGLWTMSVCPILFRVVLSCF